LQEALEMLEAQKSSGLPVLYAGPKSVVYSRADAFWRLLDDVDLSEVLFGNESFDDIVKCTFVGEAIVPHLDLVRAALLKDPTLADNRQVLTMLTHDRSPQPVVSAVVHGPITIPFPHTLGKITGFPQAAAAATASAPPPAAAATASAPPPAAAATASASPPPAAAGLPVPHLVSLWRFF
jgi:hypothetical protein